MVKRKQNQQSGKKWKEWEELCHRSSVTKACHTASSERPPKERLRIGRFMLSSPSSKILLWANVRQVLSSRANDVFYSQRFHPFERESRSCNGHGNTTETNWNRPLILAAYGHGNFKRNNFVGSWPWLQPFSPQVVRVSLSARGKSSPTVANMEAMANSWKTWTGIWRCGKATEHNDSGHSFQGLNKLFTNVVQIMYIAPTTVHQCSASKLESFALHGSTHPRRSAKEDAEWAVARTCGW